MMAEKTIADLVKSMTNALYLANADKAGEAAIVLSNALKAAVKESRGAGKYPCGNDVECFMQESYEPRPCDRCSWRTNAFT